VGQSLKNKFSLLLFSEYEYTEFREGMDSTLGGSYLVTVGSEIFLFFLPIHPTTAQPWCPLDHQEVHSIGVKATTIEFENPIGKGSVTIQIKN
jgi:hypothetical protein